MIERSVPGYPTVIRMMGTLARYFARPEGVIYDLGCSLGATTRVIQQSLASSDHVLPYRIVAVDNAPAMIERFRDEMPADVPGVRIKIELGDVRTLAFEPASLVVLNYTLQFIPLAERDALLKSIHNALLPGGALVVSEKITSEDLPSQELLVELHHAFKRDNGYSDLEVSQKRSALENVLVPETIERHLQRFEKVGFNRSTVWFQCMPFASFLAVKE